MPTKSPGQPATSATEVKLAPFPLGLKRRWLWLLQALRQIAAALGVSLSFGIEGAKRIQRRTDGGFDVFGIEGEQAGPPDPPWTVTLEGAVVPCTINGLMPVIGTTPLDDDPPPLLTFPPNGATKVYLRLQWSVTMTYDYLTAASLTSVSIHVATALPADTVDVKHRQLASVLEAVPSAPFYDAALTATLCDNGAGSTQLTLT